jgi:hypothetical protein
MTRLDATGPDENGDYWIHWTSGERQGGVNIGPDFGAPEIAARIIELEKIALLPPLTV